MHNKGQVILELLFQNNIMCYTFWSIIQELRDLLKNSNAILEIFWQFASGRSYIFQKKKVFKEIPLHAQFWFRMLSAIPHTMRYAIKLLVTRKTSFHFMYNVQATSGKGDLTGYPVRFIESIRSGILSNTTMTICRCNSNQKEIQLVAKDFSK